MSWKAAAPPPNVSIPGGGARTAPPLFAQTVNIFQLAHVENVTFTRGIIRPPALLRVVRYLMSRDGKCGRASVIRRAVGAVHRRPAGGYGTVREAARPHSSPRKSEARGRVGAKSDGSLFECVRGRGQRARVTAGECSALLGESWRRRRWAG